MEVYSQKTAQIVEVQHELVMSIGLDLNLDTMLSKFMQTCIHQLGLESAHFFLYKIPETNASLKHQLSIPNNSVFNPLSTDTALASSSTLRPIQNQHGDNFELIYAIKNAGVIVFRKKTTGIEETLSFSLIPIMERLAISCQACLDHQNIINEVNARKEAEAAVLKHTYLDTLTNLPNRKMLYEKLGETLGKSNDKLPAGALFSVDIDKFKHINDTLGHAIADKLLIEVATILKRSLREDDFIARMGGDEFVLVTNNPDPENIDTRELSEAIANRVLDATSQPLQLSDISLHVSLSIGISLFPEHITDNASNKENSENLVKYADTAMHLAKHKGRDSWEFFHPNMQIQSDNRLIIEKQLRHALENQELEMHYQPIVAPDGRIVGGESLVRWTNKELGRVSPADFIPIAEESGLIKEIGEWTIEDACHLIRKIQDDTRNNHYPHFQYLSVNVSPRQFKQPFFADNVIRIVERIDVDPQQLRLEVTEGIAIDNISETVKKMQKLQDYGISFSLDDFGTGYSSLSYLHQLPLQTIKIDQSFVTNISDRPENQAIVDATVAMAEHMGKYCIIEGVETQEDLEYFNGISISAMQGYFFSHPVPEAEFLALLHEGSVFQLGDPACESPDYSVSSI